MVEDSVEDVIDGCIHSIHVKNFFCHDNLEVNFNKNINFIVGRNGSGKSAILTALVVGLGGRASATNRGNNLHSFIKKGANSATVEIKIKNSSPKAFKPELYGDYITIIRTINSSGGSSYKVKSASGEVISTKYEEVNAIIVAHDIQVDNPISVLNQDDARSFHASDAKKKYSLFRKATNLDQTETNYVRALENCNKATAIWNRKNEACQELEKEYEKWKTSYEQLQSRDEIEVKKQLLQNEYYWSEIAEFEQEAAQVQTQYDKQKQKIDKLMEKLSKINDNFGSSSETIDGLKSQYGAKNLEKTSLEQELSTLEGEARSAQAAWRSLQQASARQLELRARENRKVADLQQEIDNFDSGQSVSLERRAEEAGRRAAAAGARYTTLQHDATQARANFAHAQLMHEKAATTAQRARDNLKHLKQQLRELESRGNDSLAVYGTNMVELCQRVQRAASRGEFSAPPRGPIGSYLKVKEKKWAGALEHIIGGSILSFCVNTPEDSRKLFDIMGQVYGNAPKPAVTCSKFLSKMHDVSRNTVRAPPYRSALESLDVTDPVVWNFLVDNIGLEGVLLVPDHEGAMRLLGREQDVPAGCARVVTADGSEYHPPPAYRCYGGAARPARRLQVGTAERKRQVQAEIKEAETELKALEAKVAELSAEVESGRAAEIASGKALQALLAERHRCEAEARTATDQLQAHQKPHYAVLMDELNLYKEKVRKMDEELKGHTEKEREYQNKMSANDESIRKVKSKLLQVSTECRNLLEEVEHEQLKLDQGTSERQTCQQKLKEDQNKLAKVAAILEEKKAHIDKLIKEALTLCPRVENPRERGVVSRELQRTQLKLSSLRKDGLSRAEVAERLLHSERRFRATKNTLDRLKHLIDEIKNTTDIHLNFCYKVQTFIARRVQHCFQSILTLRGYSGRMEIDNGCGTLDMVCAGRGAGGARRAASSASLSGGERSYSTVAFLMALWECVELPFYFMDEFDVFMDSVNRKIVMELLIDHALKNTNRQFVFLTPQDTSTVTAGPNISIHLMADPRP